MTPEQFEKMGMKKNPDGSYSKAKTVPQPREIYAATINGNTGELEIKTRPVVRVVDQLQLIEDKTNIAHLKSQIKASKKGKKYEPVYFNGMDIQDVYAMCHLNKSIFIPGNVPSLKNSKQLFTNKKTGKTFITSSELCKKYVKSSEIHWLLFKSAFLEMIKDKPKPYKIDFFFIRDKHKAFDYVNVCQINLDLMQEHGWIEDDDNRNVIPHFSGDGYDPKLSGVIIKVL